MQVEIAPVPATAQKPEVSNEDRSPTFATQTPTLTPTQRQSLTQQLLEIEQLLIQDRTAISNFTPQATSQSISQQIQQTERNITQLRNNINAASRETITQTLQQAEDQLEQQRRRLTNLEPAASVELEKNRLEQTRQRIINLRTNLNNSSQQTSQQSQQTLPTNSTGAQSQNTTEVLERLVSQVTNTAIGIALLTPLVVPINQTATNTTPEALKNAAASGVCSTLKPGGCMSGVANNAQTAANNSTANQGLLNQILNILRGANETLLPFIWQRVQVIDTKLGAQMPGGLSGVLTRLSTSLGIDRAMNLINFAANLHNALMLSGSLKVTLLGMLSSVGNATGLLQTSEGDNVDLNAVFNAGIERVMTLILGEENYAGLKIEWRKYNRIYQAAANSLNAVSSMFNSIGNVIELTAEHTGKIGNALKAAGAVSENAYQWFSEKANAKMSKFISFENKVGNTVQVLDMITQVADSVVDAQQSATEFQKANKEFVEAIQNADKNQGTENKAIKEEVALIRENSTKDPSGSDDTGLFSFLTDN